MKILVDINHPAHVHFFKNFIWKMKEKGHEIIITASKKDIALELLDGYQFSYIFLGSYGESIFKKLMNIPIMAFKMIGVIRRHNPDLLIGLGSSRITHAAAFKGKKSYVFTDTEHAKEQIALFKPFASKIITPSSFQTKLGKKHITYDGYHELSYLHPDEFKPNPIHLKEIGLEENEPFFLLRFVSWNASHDIGQKEMDINHKRKLIHLLQQKGRVLISSEGPIPKEFESLACKISPIQMHHLLYYSSIYIGEGGTMAIEAAILGTPSILINPLKAGVFQELDNKYELMYQVKDANQAIVKIQDWIDKENFKQEWRKKLVKLLTNKINVTDWMINFVENSNLKK